MMWGEELENTIIRDIASILNSLGENEIYNKVIERVIRAKDYIGIYVLDCSFGGIALIGQYREETEQLLWSPIMLGSDDGNFFVSEVLGSPRGTKSTLFDLFTDAFSLLNNIKCEKEEGKRFVYYR